MRKLMLSTVMSAALVPCANAIELTGADILAQATFPNDLPDLSGTSLVFGPATHYTFEKLMSLPVSQYVDSNGVLDVTFNVTRLECAPGTCGPDFNPVFGLSDGTNIVVMSIGEDGNGAIGASGWLDYGAYSGGWTYAVSWFNTGFPAYGEPISFSVQYTLSGTGTVTDGQINATNVTYNHPTVLDPNNLSIVLIHDNDLGERYQIDSLGITTREQAVAVDVKPGSCPNPIGLKKAGVLPVAINGTATFSALDIDPATVAINGVPALRSSIEDVASVHEPVTGKSGRHDCTTAGGDGIVDLTLKFDTQAVLDTLQPVAVGDEVRLSITGNLRSGEAIVGEDIVWIRP